MLAKLTTYTLVGIEAHRVEVEVDVSPSVSNQVTLVGLPEAAVRESLHRVERAIANSGFRSPEDRVVINLAPAELPKQAASFDLPISLGLLLASGQLQCDHPSQYVLSVNSVLRGNFDRFGAHCRWPCKRRQIAHRPVFCCPRKMLRRRPWWNRFRHCPSEACRRPFNG